VEARAEIVTGEEAARGMQLLNKKYFPWKTVAGIFRVLQPARADRLRYPPSVKKKKQPASDGSEVLSLGETQDQSIEPHQLLAQNVGTALTAARATQRWPAVSKLYRRPSKDSLRTMAPRAGLFQMPLTKGPQAISKKCGGASDAKKPPDSAYPGRNGVWPAR